MKFPFLILALLAGTAAVAEEEVASDFLRFKNGDTLHGKYLGLDEGPIVQWQSSEATEPIPFETKNLRKLSLNKGRAQLPLTSAGLVELSNGDRIPGDLVAMSADSLTLQTQFAGQLTIPRDTVRLILPNRHGGDVLYAGPFNDLNWEVPGTRKAPSAEEVENNDTEQIAEGNDAPPPLPDLLNEVANDNLPPKPEEPLPDPKKPWVYGSAAWLSNSDEVIRLDTELPDLVSIRFKLAWQSPLNAAIAVFADFQRPPLKGRDPRVRRVALVGDEEVNAKDAKDLEEAEPEEEEELEPQFIDVMDVGPGGNDAESYGSGYLISLLSSYSKLQRLQFDEQNEGQKISFPNSGGRLKMGTLFSAEFEIRGDRAQGKISLFVNGEFYSEWSDLAEPLEKTPRYFAISTGGKSRILSLIHI